MHEGSTKRNWRETSRHNGRNAMHFNDTADYRVVVASLYGRVCKQTAVAPRTASLSACRFHARIKSPTLRLLNASSKIDLPVGGDSSCRVLDFLRSAIKRSRPNASKSTFGGVTSHQSSAYAHCYSYMVARTDANGNADENAAIDAARSHEQLQ
jgi:hypothetical protein